MAIQVLSEQLASQIAAGEVVERPASAVKELVENALDAGATTINIDIRQGGRQSIQIADDGCGIPADQVEIAFLRHATSKISSADGLAAIETLGFRGEALAAIAAVSQTTIVTRAAEESAGIRITLDGGHVRERDRVGAPQGTVISIENLFYNVPARLKFLKTVGTEKKQIDQFVTKYALAYPHVRFRLTHDGRITFQTSGSGNLRDVLLSMHGAEIAKQLMPIGETAYTAYGEDEEKGEGEMGRGLRDLNVERTIKVSGYVAPPSVHRATRNQITLFVNGRWIKDKNLTYAIIQAYHTLLPTGRYPIAVVFVQMPLQQVDVNVHPTKTEVRFTEARRVFGAVQKAIREALLEDTPVRSIRSGHFESLTGPSPATWQGGQRDAFSSRSNSRDWDVQPGRAETLEWGESQPAFHLPEVMPDRPTPLIGRPEDELQRQIPPDPLDDLAGEKLPIMRVVGQVGASYIITEGPEGMYMIDQHAAHERIQFENFMAAHARKEIPSQGLVAGATVQLAPDQATLLEESVPTLTELGFQVEHFGPNAFKVRAVPAVVANQDPTRVILDILTDLERGDAPLQAKIEEKIIRRVCKTASIKAGQTLTKQEMEALIRQLERCHNPHTCPHGRPTLIFLSVTQLAKEFGR